MAVLPRPDMRRILSRLGNPICTAIVHTPAKDSRASPGPARQDRSARSCHGPATVRWQARFPRRGKRREGHRRHASVRLTRGLVVASGVARLPARMPERPLPVDCPVVLHSVPTTMWQTHPGSLGLNSTEPNTDRPPPPEQEDRYGTATFVKYRCQHLVCVAGSS